MKRRRSSSCRFASTSSRCCISIRCVIRLKARLRISSSPSASPFRHPRGEVPGTHPLRGGDELAHRARDLRGDHDADPDRGDEEEQRDHEEDERERDLEARPLAFQALVLRDRPLGVLHMGQHLRVDEASDEKVGVAESVEADEGPDPVVVVARYHGDIAGARTLHRPFGDGLELEREGEAAARENAPGAVENHRLGKVAERRLRLHHLGETLRVEQQESGFLVEVVRHRRDVRADRVLVLAEIALGDGEALAEGGAHPVAEPRLDAEAEEEIREDRNDDGRRHRDGAEQPDEADVKPRSGEAAAPLGPDLDEAEGDDRAEEQKKDEVDVEKEENGLRARPERRRPVIAA